MITKEEYMKLTQEKLENIESKNIMFNQIENYYKIIKEHINIKHPYHLGDNVYLKKGTLLHGTYKNIEGLREIVKNGLISSWFIDARISKYPSSVGVWNLKQNYLLKDYIDFYSGGTILYNGIYEKDSNTKTNISKIIPYSKMHNINEEIRNYKYHMWSMEQTKESRFLPSLVQNHVQIGIIFNGQSQEIKELLKGDILSDSINDSAVKEFLNPDYYERFIKDRKRKDDFFTDRESAILFGIPACFIEGILVGKNYENDSMILEEIKKLLPYAYICNLDGNVIME